VRIDERSAGFLALGLAKLHHHPVAVTTTSGTAAVNLHPAVVEADYAGVPVIVLTADRPVEMRGTGANQTIDQTNLFGGSVRHFAELSADTAPTEAEQRAMVREAVTIARGERGARQAVAYPHGPVHLNVGLREPLIPDGTGRPDVEGLAVGRADRAPDAAAASADPNAATDLENRRRVAGDDASPGTGTDESLSPVDPRGLAADPSGSAIKAVVGQPLVLTAEPRRTLVVAGDGAGWGAFYLAEAGGWPLLAEPSSGARSGSNALAAYRLYLDQLADDVERVLVLGRPTLSRPVARLLARNGVDVVRVGVADWHGLPETPPDSWARRWLAADTAARRAISAVLVDDPLSGPAVAAAVAECLPTNGLLIAGSSSSIRDLDLAAPFEEPPADTTRRVLANRGASGIDGTVSTAIGAALAHQRSDRVRPEARQSPAYALMGDLTFLHDSNGLVLGPDEPRPDLTIVVVNDDGGGLFSLLEQGEPERASAFERIFGTPHHVDIGALCAATSTPYARATTVDELRHELAQRPQGIRVVEVPVDRSRTRDLHARLKAAALDAIAHLTR
jgi:2-succinyl-5-enolpyruvyl-6-hydroxy-3-cyclohexene-1-carboxylate synthase